LQRGGGSREKRGAGEKTKRLGQTSRGTCNSSSKTINPSYSGTAPREGDRLVRFSEKERKFWGRFVHARRKKKRTGNQEKKGVGRDEKRRTSYRQGKGHIKWTRGGRGKIFVGAQELTRERRTTSTGVDQGMASGGNYSQKKVTKGGLRVLF